MAISSVEAFAPASIANLGVGFDIVGLALSGRGDRLRLSWRDEPGIVIDVEGDGGLLPRAPERNVAAVSASAMLQHIGEERGLHMTLYKGLPLSSGLGSSAASAVVSVVALNALLGEPFTRTQLLPFCLEGEALVSGYHADNVAPCLLGGIILVAGIVEESIQALPVPDGLHLALITPDLAVPTNRAREVLPRQVPLGKLIHQTGAVAQLVDALHRGDLQDLGAAMERDQIVEPARAALMPQLAQARHAAKSAGAIALFIGGAGPTLCAIADSAENAQAACAAMQAVYNEVGMASQVQATQVSPQGAQLLHVY